MHSTGQTTRTVPDVLRAAATGLTSGAITWGREELVNETTGSRCALGAISWAADPADRDGDPHYVQPGMRLVALQAVDALADYLITELDATEAGGLEEVEPGREVWVRDPGETIGGFNDEQAGPGPVIAALLAAAARAGAVAA